MSPTVEVEKASRLPSQIEEAAKNEGWEIIWTRRDSINLPLDRVRFDIFVLKKDGRTEVAGVVFMDGENDLLFGSEEFLTEIGISNSEKEL